MPEPARTQNFNPLTIWFDYCNTSWLKNHPAETSTVNDRLRGMGKFIDSFVTKGWGEIDEMKSSFDRFEIQKRDETDPRFNDYHLQVIEETNTYKLSERSKGLRWFFSFMILTQIRSQRDDGDIIFLLDDPASNLHIHPQDKILKNLNKLAKKKCVIYSTHAPHLIDADNLDLCLVMVNDKKREVNDANIVIKSFNDIAQNQRPSKQEEQSIAPILEIGAMRKIIPDSFKMPEIWAGMRNVAAVAKIIKIISDIMGG